MIRLYGHIRRQIVYASICVYVARMTYMYVCKLYVYASMCKYVHVFNYVFASVCWRAPH